MENLKEKLRVWYDAHIAAAWYKSAAIYVGMVAALFPYALDLLDAALQQWPQVAEVLRLSPLTTMILQIVLATVVLPAARAWQQKSVRQASLKQAAEAGILTSAKHDDVITIRVPGKPELLVVPTPDEPGSPPSGLPQAVVLESPPNALPIAPPPGAL